MGGSQVKATAQIFLSYAREDEGKVEKLYQELSDAGFKPWMDTKDILPGERWQSSIRKAVRRSDFFLACLSANSVSKRGWIQREIRDALDIWQEKLEADIYLIPVRLEDCEVPESLCDFQWVDLFEEDGWTRLVKAIQVGVERWTEETKPIIQESTPLESHPGHEELPLDAETATLGEGPERILYDFTLILVASGTDYLVRAECPLVGEAGPQTIKRADLANLSSVGERLTSGDINDIVSAGQIGHGLYQTIFQDSLHELFQRALAVACDRSVGLRILLKFKQTPELHEIPWELLHDGRQFLATNPATPIVRYLEQPSRVESLEVEPPLRVLFTTACPKDHLPLDLATEERNMRVALEPFGGAVELVVERNISLDRLRHALMRAQNRERPFHVWHHCGHGELSSQNDTTFFGLVLEDRNVAQWVDVAQVSTLVRACPSLRMVTQNICHSGSSVGLGPALAFLNVPVVVGFRGSVLDRTALTFAESFYEAIFHNPVDVALGQARMALAAKDSQSLDWALPLLFLRTTSPILMTRSGIEPTAASAPVGDATDTISIGPIVKIKGKSWKVGQTKIIGVMTVGDKAPSIQSNLQFEFDPQSFETESLLQIGGLSISSEEAARHFEDIQNLAHSLTSDLPHGDMG
jgi:hypothetical protein